MTDTTTTTQRQTPWERMGLLPTELTDATVESILEYADLDFTVSKRPIRYQKQDGTWADQADRVFVVRDTDEVPFDVVSKDYGVFQYSEAFDFLNHLEGAEFVAAHALKDGKQAYMVVRLPDLDEFSAGGDQHELDVLIRTSHDRTRAVEVFTMPMRIWCTNQLPIRPMGQGITNRWSVNHIGNVNEKMHDAEKLVTNVRSYVEDFKNTAQRLVNIKLDTGNAQDILTRTLRKSVKQDEVVESIVSLWQNADTVGNSDNGWGLVNAVSDYYEHGRNGGTPQSRLLGALEGQTRGILDRVVPFVLGRYGR